MKHLKNKVVVVTGAGAGIGRALSLELLSQNAHVALVDINPNYLKETAALCENFDGKATCHLADISDRNAIKKIAQDIFQQRGRVDVLINNAGGSVIRANVADISYEHWELMMNSNFWGALNCIKYFLPYLQQREAAHIVNVSSIFSMAGADKRGPYCASKFALRGLTECLIQEFHGTNIGVTSVLPGGVKTNITLHSVGWKDPVAQQKSANLLKRSARTTPEEAAKQIVRAIKANKKRLVIGPDAKILDRLIRYFPVFSEKILHFIFTRMEDRFTRKMQVDK